MAVPKHFNKQTLPGEEMWIQDIQAYVQSGVIRRAFHNESEKNDLATSIVPSRREAKLHWNIAKRYSHIAADIDPRKISTLEQFLEHVRCTNTNWNEQDQLQRKSMNFRQKQSVTEYATQLLLLADQLNPRPSEHEILERFKHGLQERIGLVGSNVAEVGVPPIGATLSDVFSIGSVRCGPECL